MTANGITDSSRRLQFLIGDEQKQARPADITNPGGFVCECVCLCVSVPPTLHTNSVDLRKQLLIIQKPTNPLGLTHPYIYYMGVVCNTPIQTHADTHTHIHMHTLLAEKEFCPSLQFSPTANFIFLNAETQDEAFL